MGCPSAILDGMGRGPGVKQKALIRALRVPGRVVWVVPPDVNRSEAVCWRRAARGVVRRGKARAVYLRRTDKLGRRVAHLALVAPGSPVVGDALPIGSPEWIDPSVERLFETLGSELKAAVMRDLGVPVSPRTAARRAAEHHRDQPGIAAVFAA